MSEHNTPRLPGPNGQAALDLEERGLRAPAHYGTLRKIWWWFDFLILVKLARLRFIAILVAVGAVIVYWETLHAYYDKWTRPLVGAEQTVSADTEFWCPMHPTIVRDKPDKCPICAMPLSKRKKGTKSEEEALPPGILTRLQLTPLRVAQAGVQTVDITPLPLTKQIQTVGFVEFDERKLARISVRPTGKSRIDKLYVNVTGQTVQKGEPLALLYNPDLVVTVQNLLDARKSGDRYLERLARDRLQLWGIEPDQIEHVLHKSQGTTHLIIRAPISGHVIRKYPLEGEYVEEGARLFDVADVSTVWIEAQVYEDEIAFLKKEGLHKNMGQAVSATTSAFPSRKFAGKVAFIHPHLDRASRTLRVRFDMDNPDHELRPGMYATVTLEVPARELELLSRSLTDHPERGSVLAVPERAVIDTGSRQIVYREYLPNEFEGVLVELGPRMVGPDKGTYYPVIRGLQAGDKVVTAGSFLIDAETRLTAGASSTYFGASGGPQGTDRRSVTTAGSALVEDEDAKVKAALGKLSSPDRRLAEAQAFCPVLRDSRLGSMGVPVKVMVKGQPVFLCCKGCQEKALANPDQTLANVEKHKAKAKGAARQGPRPPTPARPALTPEEAAEVNAALAKLSPEDRRLAQTQVFCAVQGKNYLGSMGTPVKVMVKGRPVFLCCDGCEQKALANPDQTLANALKHKAGAKAPPPQK